MRWLIIRVVFARIYMRKTQTRLYHCWSSMKQRCYYRKNNRYNYYGGKGITVCKEWKDSFDNFKEWALSNGYKDNLTIDRIDPNKNYEPSNCRWITKQENSKNATAKQITCWNETKNIKDWYNDKRCNVSYDTLRNRILRGLDPEWSITTPQHFKVYNCFGELKTLAQWSKDERCQVTKQALWHRLKQDVPIEEALTTPKQPGRRKKT